ncbi:MAG TPA: hypothetical protein VIH85_07365 [Solirubrobacteraceae bacterium]
MLGEAESMQRRDLGFRMTLSAGKPDGALGQRGGGGRVGLD